MISNRRGARPSSSPIEHLREFAINTSKGIDITQSPINGNTVAHSKNLIVNPDGSLSLRKPLKYVSSTVGKCFQLFDGTKMELIDAHELYIGDQTTNVQLEWYSYKGERHAAPFANVSTDLFKDNSKISVLNLNTSSIICNAEVLIGIFNEDDNIIDTALYDIEDKTTFAVPRYVKISKGKLENGAEGYTLTIMNPEPNELRFGTDGELALDPNLVLDNPYAIRDVYDAVTPVFKGVIGYKYAQHFNGRSPQEIPLEYETITNTSTRYSPKLTSKSTAQPSKGLQVIEFPFKYTFPETTTLALTVSLSVSPKANTAAEFVIRNLKIAGKVHSEHLKSLSILSDLSLNVTSDNTNSTYSIPVKSASFETSDFEFKKDVAVQFTWTDLSSLGLHIPALGIALESETTRLNLGSYITSVDDLTASNRKERFTPVEASGNGLLFLKAFGYVPTHSETPKYYASWYVTDDGVTWLPASPTSPYSDSKLVEPGDTILPIADYIPLTPTSSYSALEWSSPVYKGRPDILIVDNVSPSRTYKFRVVTLGTYEEFEDGEGLPSIKIYKEGTLVSEVVYNVFKAPETSFAYVDFANPVLGEKLYHKKRIYSYGHEKFFNNIFVSGIDNFETPLYNVIDIDAKQSDNATALVPWRDYLMSATTNSMYLHTPQDNGFLTKTVTTSLGIPKEDSKCCVPVLNGVIVKSNSMVYLIYPNAYAGTDSVLNVAPISQPVEEYLQDFEEGSDEKPFAFSTESEYVLMLPYTEKTICLRYNYTTRIWCMCEYPVRLYDYRINTVEDIRLYGKIPKKVSDTDFLEVYAEFEFDSDSELYADIIGETEVPIEFEWDSGQKTDNIATRKQFTESKIVFSTEDEIENFPMELIVAVDGDPNITRIDVRTDAPLIKTTESVGVLGTNLRLSEDFSDPNVSKSGLIRQLIVRYSGRGRSVRHILRGVAKSPFRMYEAYVRYKLVDNKR